MHRIKVARHFQRTDSSADLAKLLDDPNILRNVVSDSSEDESDEKPSLKDRIVKLATGTAPGHKAKNDSPTARLKLLLIAAFLILHALNLVGTLTTKAIHRRHTTQTVSNDAFDTSSPLLGSTLRHIVDVHPDSTDLVVHLAAVLQFRATDPSDLSTPAANTSFVNTPVDTSRLASLDRFMSSWTTLVGDPVMSKWIVCALIISVVLNGYLLRGIASNADSGFAPGSAAEAAARILLASTSDVVDETEDEAEIKARLRRRWEEGVVSSELQKDWTQDDAAAMTRHHRRQEARAAEESTRHAPEILKVTAKKSAAQEDKDESSSSSDSAPSSPLMIKTKNLHSAAPKERDNSGDKTPSAAAGPSLTVNGTQREIRLSPSTVALVAKGTSDEPRPLDTCVKIFDNGAGAMLLTDEEVIMLVQKGKIAAYALEKLLKDYERSVYIRRALVSRASARKTLEASDLPYQHYDYSRVMGQCCENVVGYMPIPVGIAGPLRIDGEVLPVPMATTEGALVASTSRGCKALNVAGGVSTVVTQDAMTRGPALSFPNAMACAAAKRWIDSEEGSNIMKAAFNSTSRFARLKSLKAAMAGRTLFVRFATQTGDAMGMNMISKGLLCRFLVCRHQS